MARTGTADGGGSSAGAIRAGRAFVELSLRDNNLARGLQSIQARLQRTGAMVAKIGAVGVGAGVSMLAPLGAALASAVTRGADVQKLANQLGTTAEELTSLGHAAEVAGIPLAEFADTAKDLQEKISEAAMGEGIADVFREIGVSANELLSLSLPQQFDAIADGIAKLEKPADRTRVAMALMSDNGFKLLDVLGKGSQGFRDAASDAKKLGTVVSNIEGKEASAVWTEFNRTMLAVRSTISKVGLALLPGAELLEAYRTNFVNVVGAAQGFIAVNRPVILGVAALGGALVVGGSALIGLGGAFSVASVAMGGLTAAFTAALSPIGLLVGSVGALGVAYLTGTEKGKKFVEWFKSGFAGELKDSAHTVETAWQGIVDAIKAGDLELAAKVSLAALEYEFAKARLELTKIWNGMKTDFGIGTEVLKEGLGIPGLMQSIEQLKAELGSLPKTPAPGQPGGPGGPGQPQKPFLERVPTNVPALQNEMARSWLLAQNKLGILSDKEFYDRYKATLDIAANERAEAEGRVAAAVRDAAKRLEEQNAKATAEAQEAIDKARTVMIAQAMKAFFANARANQKLEVAPSPRLLGISGAMQSMQSRLAGSQAIFDSRNFSAIFSRGVSIEKQQLDELKGIKKDMAVAAAALAGAGPLVYSE